MHSSTPQVGADGKHILCPQSSENSELNTLPENSSQIHNTTTDFLSSSSQGENSDDLTQDTNIQDEHPQLTQKSSINMKSIPTFSVPQFHSHNLSLHDKKDNEKNTTNNSSEQNSTNVNISFQNPIEVKYSYDGVPKTTWQRWNQRLAQTDLVFDAFTSPDEEGDSKIENYRIKDDSGDFDFVFLAPLGKGVSGAVYLVKVLNNRKDPSLIGALYAIKIYKSDSISINQGNNEMLMIPFVQRISGTYSSNKKKSIFPTICMKMQIRGHISMLMNVYGPTLFQVIAIRNYNGLPLSTIRSIMTHILQGLVSLESRGVVHGDIKPENVLISMNNIKRSTCNPNIAMAANSVNEMNNRRLSFGPNSLSSGLFSFKDYTESLSMITNVYASDDYDSNPGVLDIAIVDWSSSSIGYNQQSPYVQSRYYRAPEVLLRVAGKFGPSADVWSLGCVAAEMFLGSPLFPGGDELDMLCQIQLKLGLIPQSLVRKIGDSSPAKHSDEWKIDPSMYVPGNFEIFLRERSGRDDFDFLAFINILRLMLQLNPDARITASSAMLHPFITGITNTQLQTMRARRDSCSSSSFTNPHSDTMAVATGSVDPQQQQQRMRSKSFKRKNSKKGNGTFDDSSCASPSS